MRTRDVIEGAAFLTGLAGAGMLLVAAGAGESVSPDAEWWTRVLPIGVLLYFWPVCLGRNDLARRSQYPLLFRYSLETAVAFTLLAAGYAVSRGYIDGRFWGILGGTIAALACAVRVRLETEARGEAVDRSLGILSEFVRAKRWRPSVR